MPKEFHAGLQESAIGPLHMYTMPQKTLQDFLKMLPVLHAGLASDDIINIASYSIGSLEDGIHCPLENGRSRGNPKWEPGVLIQTLGCGYGDIFP